MLAKISESEHSPTPEELLAELVRWGGAERGFLVWMDRIWAVDLDGFSLGHSGERLQSSWLPAPGRVSKREEPSAVLAATLRTGAGTISVLLEHRFRTRAFLDVNEEEFRRCVLVAVTAFRWAVDVSVRAPGRGRRGRPPGSASKRSADDAASEEETESRAALVQHSWNISRAARSLGMTRHGLKKRMSRLGIERPAHSKNDRF